jgi:hypothetical protein
MTQGLIVLIRTYLRVKFPDAQFHVRKARPYRDGPDLYIMWVLGPSEETVRSEIVGVCEGLEEEMPHARYARGESQAALAELRPR